MGDMITIIALHVMDGCDIPMYGHRIYDIWLHISNLRSSDAFSQQYEAILGVFADIHFRLQQSSEIMSHNQDIFRIGFLFGRDTSALSTLQHDIRCLHHGTMHSST